MSNSKKNQNIRIKVDYDFSDFIKKMQLFNSEFLYVTNIIKEVGSKFKNYNELFIKKMSEVRNGLNIFAESMRAIFSPEVIKYFNSLPEIIKKSFVELANHGWFIDSNMSNSFIQKVSDYFIIGKSKYADKLMIQYYTNNFETIEKTIIEKYPKRHKILKSAFNAYKSKKYELCIPIFLAQADGICYESIGLDLYRKRNKQPVTKKYVDENIKGRFSQVFMYSLTETLPIRASSNERQNDLGELNRHLILHGISNDYGTKVNGLKSLSLLNHISQILSDKI